jgi:hypothetical protein
MNTCSGSDVSTGRARAVPARIESLRRASGTSTVKGRLDVAFHYHAIQLQSH